MDHRWLKRQIVKMDVQLCNQGKYLGTAYAIDISGDGMRIVSSGIDLHPGQIVEMGFPQRNRPFGSGDVRAIVVYTVAGYAGVMFVPA